MPDAVSITVNGAGIMVPSGTTALAAILSTGASTVRRSVSGALRGPLCGMGVCFECRATVNRRRHSRTCEILCAPGMDIRTGNYAEEHVDG
ncbi:MAG TPA: (2Fe-2S)-binding protein [Candidatus Acidoferrales bacterium]|nr:(2Fe-2S)-binding protein [Candidatus Acidoferrales bacterium]